MPDWIGRGSTRAARRAPLYDYLKTRRPGDVILEGSSLRLANNRSVVVSDARTGFIDYSTGETGNPIDFLVRYLGYGFQDAVAELCGYMSLPTDLLNVGDLIGYAPPTAPPAAVRAPPPQAAPPKPFVPPPPVQGPYRRLFAYLVHRRGIPAWLVQRLVDSGLLYEDAAHGNAVFMNAARTYAELRGTVPGRPFHGLAPGSGTEEFWWFKPGPPASPVTAAFICEGAIDAMSLYLLRQRQPLPPGDNPMYCSIGGVANQQRIDVIKSCMGAAGRPRSCPATPRNRPELQDACSHTLFFHLRRTPSCPAPVPARFGGPGRFFIPRRRWPSRGWAGRTRLARSA